MISLDDHPTVKRVRAGAVSPAAPTAPLEAGWLTDLCVEAGADDVGFVEIGRPELADQRADILGAFPRARALVAFVCRMHRDNVRVPARSVANLEFHHTGDRVNEVARRIAATLGRHGVRAINAAMGFPMEMDRFPGKTWVVSHKPVAVAAGLGRMGIHRNVIHPRFGNFILLGTVVIDAGVTEYGRPLDFNPCLECKLCVAACPVGAIGADGRFDFSACYTHNYREFMGGFADWVERVADSRNARAYRRAVGNAETVSLWQSLAFGPNYKAAYCMAVCPAGEDVIGPFLSDRKRFQEDVVRPLQRKVEPVYVIPGSDAEGHVTRRFPHKRPRRVGRGTPPATIDGFLRALPLLFQRERSAGLDAVYHFTFTGEASRQATVAIRDRTLRVDDGHVGRPDLRVVADGATWLRFLAGDTSLLWALVRRRIRVAGPPRLLRAFGRCFPS